MIFLDSSALAKAYLDEEGTDVVRGAIERLAGRLFISEFMALEVLTTLRTTFRKASKADWDEVVEEFWADYEGTFNVVEIGPEVVDRAMSLAVNHRMARARSMDLLHVATALHMKGPHSLKQVTIVTSDRDLAEICRRVRTADVRSQPRAAVRASARAALTPPIAGAREG